MAQTPISELEARLAQASVEPVDPKQRVDALNDLAWAVRNGDTPRANALATEARQLAADHGYKLGQARAARTMAMSVRDTEGLHDLFRLADESKRLFDEVDDGPGRAASRDFLASIHEHMGDLAGGLALALDALSIARELGDPVRQGYALSSVGGILSGSGEVDAAVQHLKEALALFQSVPEPAGVGAICSRLSKVLQNAERSAEALTYAQLCRDAAETTGDEYLHWASLTLMAEIADSRGNAREAEALYRAALDSWNAEFGRNMMGGETQIALGRLLLRRGDLAAADFELTDALSRIPDSSVAIVDRAAAHEALAELREHQGNLPATIEHLREAKTLRDQISRRDARNKLAQVEARAAVEAANQDAEIHKLRFVELHGMQSKLVEAEKMAFLGKLAAGAAHELNTPLAVLRSNTELSTTVTDRLLALVRDKDELGVQGTKLASVLESCRQTSDEALERIATVAQSFGRFTQLDHADLRSFDVHEGLDSALALLRPSIPQAIRLERRFEQVPPIEAWPRELNHAFMTVLQNAVQAIEGTGVVSAETSATEEYVLVRIRDTGRGMSEEQSAYLFDVSWSEHGARTRMRLGLSAAYTTMQKHNGTLAVQSVLHKGTTVTFRFPIPRPAPPSTPPQS